MPEYRLTRAPERADNTRCAMCGFIIYRTERYYVADGIGALCVTCLDHYTVRFEGADNYVIAPDCAVNGCPNPAWYKGLCRRVGNGGRSFYYVCRDHAHAHAGRELLG